MRVRTHLARSVRFPTGLLRGNLMRARLGQVQPLHGIVVRDQVLDDLGHLLCMCLELPHRLLDWQELAQALAAMYVRRNMSGLHEVLHEICLIPNTLGAQSFPSSDAQDAGGLIAWAAAGACARYKGKWCESTSLRNSEQTEVRPLALSNGARLYSRSCILGRAHGAHTYRHTQARARAHTTRVAGDIGVNLGRPDLNIALPLPHRAVKALVNARVAGKHLRPTRGGPRPRELCRGSARGVGRGTVALRARCLCVCVYVCVCVCGGGGVEGE